ncbi:hypothetical protein [Lacinutrix sp.]|uniref:hypothetical protein n=1 Tax=Lacinutrix sp. TaxID=1937692 RepID=UPI0025C508E9|nr:hypothetical protein [Lacinutrix sp.]
MTEIIKNKKGEIAVIFKINAKTFNPINLGDLKMKDLPENYRKYLFIDDVEDSLDTRVIGKFKILFERYGLSCKRHNNGKVFPIDFITTEKSIELDVEPRHGQDGGVVGVCS